MPLPHEEVSAYGVIASHGDGENGFNCLDIFVEKASPEDTLCDLVIIVKYLISPEIFEILEKQKPCVGNEIQLTSAIDTLRKTQRLFAREFKGERHDVGD